MPLCPAPAPTLAPSSNYGCCPSEGLLPLTTEPHFEAISGVGAWVAPVNALSVSVVVREALPGTVTITTVDGVFPLRDNESYTWSAIRDRDSVLTGAFTVTSTDAATEIAIAWTEVV